MEKSYKITTSIVLLLISVSCTETVNNPDIDTATAPTALNTDTIIMIPEEESIPKDTLYPKKYIYLTIDDAPLNGSDYIDSIILSARIKTNIFLVGHPIDGSHRFRKYYNQMKKNPHIAIYNHSYSHANNRYTQYYKDPNSVLNDFEKNQTEFNIAQKIARLPGRNLWHLGERRRNYRQTGGTSADLLVENGYQVFGWDIEWHYDSKDYSAKQTIEELVDEIEEMYNASGSFTPNHIVLLMHNQMFGKVNEHNDLIKLINELRERNYTFEYLSFYPV